MGRALATRGWAVALMCVVGCDDARAPEPMHARELGGVRVEGSTLERGRTLYGRYCASCHGVDGSGNGAAAGGLPRRPRDFRKAEFAHAADGDALPTHERLVEIIRDGVVDAGMPAWRGLNDADLDALAHFLKTFSPRWSGEGGGSR